MIFLNYIKYKYLNKSYTPHHYEYISVNAKSRRKKFHQTKNLDRQRMPTYREKDSGFRIKCGMTGRKIEFTKRERCA